MLGKYILPWFGGAAAEWTACMLFFQVLLLGGYAYAHLLGSRLNSRAQALLHCAVVLSSLLLLGILAFTWSSPITPGPGWRPHGADHPVMQIVMLLGVSVGLPFFVLSSTGPLLQSWYWRVYGGDSPYRLYSLSNLGSFLALLIFPALLEFFLTVKSQAWLWSIAYFVFAVSCVYIALRASQSERDVSQQDLSAVLGEESARTRKGSYLLWVGLSACASILFLATTNQICQDIGVVPLLWVLPLGIYLLTFVICFEHERWYSRKWLHPAFGLAMWAGCFVLFDGAVGSIFAQIGIYAAVLFVFCMVCNGELVRSKPLPHFLTSFYLTVAAGGALGGIFVALVAPRIFKGFWEYQMALWLAALLLAIILIRDRESWLYRSRFGTPVMVVALAAFLPESAAFTITKWNRPVTHLAALMGIVLTTYVLSGGNRKVTLAVREKSAPVYCGAALLLAAMALGGTAFSHVRNVIAASRSFYGVLSVVPQNMDDPSLAAYCERHGRIVHGCQLRTEANRDLPTTYYGPTSGVGVAILRARAATSPVQANLRVGVVGLGIGTIAAYAKPEDTFRFYEINPDVIRIANDRRYFTYLIDSPARIEVIVGDGRLSLEHELEKNQLHDFDVLIIDAFSGDAVPVHLLTLEAFGIYASHLRKPSGILAIHITNTYLDLRPVVFGAARRLGLHAVPVYSAGDGRTTTASEWVLLSAGDNLPPSDAAAHEVAGQEANLRTIRPWTDDYSNLIQILKR